MKRMLTLFAILGLMTCSARIAGAVTLIGTGINNGDLDLIANTGDQVLATPDRPWHVTASKTLSGGFSDGASSEGFANVQQPGGFGLFFKPFQGSATTGDRVTANLFQNVIGSGAVPGATYTLTGWAGAEAGYVGLTDPSVTSQFALDFYSAANTLLSSSVLDLMPGLVANQGNGNPLNYQQYTLVGVAPAGTATVSARATMGNAYANPNGGGQAFVVDAFNLSNNAVPEPTTIALGLLATLGLFVVRRR